MLGWVDLQAEQLAEPARERLFSGELKEFPDDVRVAFTKVAHLAPEMFTWLGSRYLEHRSVNGIVEGFERFLATRDGADPSAAEPARDRLRGSLELHSPHARARRRIGGCRCDLLQRLADATATRHRGRLVKLLGDGVLLQLPHPAVGVEAALDLVEAMHGEGALASHAGVHAGPVIEAGPGRLRTDCQPRLADRGYGCAGRSPRERCRRRGRRRRAVPGSNGSPTLI